jgi:hypothetical protein
MPPMLTLGCYKTRSTFWVVQQARALLHGLAHATPSS